MTEKRFDEMMKAYCNPEVEPFTFEKKRKTRLRGVAVMAAALVLVILGAMVIPSLTGSKYDFVLTVNAEEVSRGKYIVDKKVASVKLSDTKDGRALDDYIDTTVSMSVTGDDIADIGVRSLNRHGEFFVIKNAKGYEVNDDGRFVSDKSYAQMYDADGNLDPDFMVRPVTPENDYDGDVIVDWNMLEGAQGVFDGDYLINYMPLGADGYLLQPDDFGEQFNDIAEITVTFTDGETQTRRLSVTYPDGVMTVQEIG